MSRRVLVTLPIADLDRSVESMEPGVVPEEWDAFRPARGRRRRN